jgi:CRISPR-associated protein Cas2
MTVIVTRDVADRYRGFLASVMPRAASGVYVSPELSGSVRERLWVVLEEWWRDLPGGSILMTWKDDTKPGRLGLAVLGLPPVRLSDVEGSLLVHMPAIHDDPADAGSDKGAEVGG